MESIKKELFDFKNNSEGIRNDYKQKIIKLENDKSLKIGELKISYTSVITKLNNVKFYENNFGKRRRRKFGETMIKINRDKTM